MILRRCFALRSCLMRKYLLRDVTGRSSICRNQEYSGLSSCFQHQVNLQFREQSRVRNEIENYQFFRSYLLHRKCYSKGLIEGDATELLKDIELKKTAQLFPEARVTLHILQSRTPDKIYDVHYRQYMPGKKAVRNHEWTCTYKFVWPEKMKFEYTALSKRQAAEKAALQALHWLYTNKRIDDQGRPIYDKDVLEDIKTNLKEILKADISEKSIERIERIWIDYESGIKEIYEKTAEKAKLRSMKPQPQLIKDSTIDEEDDYPEEKDSEELVSFDADTKVPVHPVYGRIITPPTEQSLRRRRDNLRRTFQEYDESITELPIDQYADQITSTLKSNQVCLIVGAAGCGKSTRVPAAILRELGVEANIIVSEPRRVAAMGLAERVASELDEEVGESIGYQVRLHSKPPRPPAGSVLYCTSGVLLNRLHSNPGLTGCSHVIIDEAHERDVNTDVTMLLLKRAMETNPQLKVVVMSATLDTDVFTKYFDSCPVIEVPGRTFPVEVTYLDEIQKKYQIQLPNTLANSVKEDGKPQLNVNEIIEVVKAVDKHEKEGAILVFLPGWAEIKYAKQLLDEHFKDSSLHMVLPVHARLSATEQSRMFSKPPLGVRKIVVSTNVAETSVTIPDVVYVIDSGACKENTLRNGTDICSLETVWTSLAAAKQRAGRAGRVQPGLCFRMYTKQKEADFVPHSTPEILRVPLEQIVLDCKTYAPEEKAIDFLSQLPEPPNSKTVANAVKTLIDIGALTQSEQMCTLGVYLSRLPMNVRYGLTLLRSVGVGAVGAGGNIAAGGEAYEVFLDPSDRRSEIREIKRQFNATSDHAALNWIQNLYEGQYNRSAQEKWCEKYGLRRERLEYIKSLSSIYLRELLQIGFIEPNIELEDLNRFSDIDELTVAILLSSFDSILITRKNVRTKGKLKTVNQVFTTKGDRAHISSDSVNFSLTKQSQGPTLVCYCGGHHSVERRAIILYKTSVISPQTAVLFSMGHVDKGECDGETTVLCVRRHHLKIHVPSSQADILLKAREMLWKTFDYYIDRDIKDLDYEEFTQVSRFKIRLIKAICRVLVEATDGAKYCDDVKDVG